MKTKQQKKIYVCKDCGKSFDTIQALGGHRRMAHPKRKGRKSKSKEREFLDFLKALLNNPKCVYVKEDGRPMIRLREVAEILKISPEKANEIVEWSIRNGYSQIIRAIVEYILGSALA